MKKLISLCISASMILITVFPTFASDYRGHWAENDIDTLISYGIVSGDENGNFNPDRNIKRAEFVKIVNKTFGYIDKSFENFPDVLKDSWYYDEFLTAKAYAYITGDENGNANAESFITRGEVSVILARVLKLITGYTDNDFSDNDSIPSWAKGSVVALVKEGYINGYPDKSFRAGNYITRAEAVSVISKCKHNREDAYNKSVDNTPKQTVPSSFSPTRTGGGGGGGGGSSSGQKVLSAPIIANADSEKLSLSWNSVSKSAYYELCLNIFDKEYKLETNDTYYDFNNKIDEITENLNDAEYKFSVKVKAISTNSSYTDSAYSKEIDLTKTYPSLETPVLTYKSGQTGVVNRGVVKISDVTGADSYDISLEVDGTKSDNFIYDLEKTVVIIEDTEFISGKDAKVIVKAVSNDLGNKKNSKQAEIKVIHSAPAIAGAGTSGTGTEDDPYIIKTAEGIQLIKDNPSAYFVIANDITLPDNYQPIPEFKGTITTDGEKRTISISLKKSEGEPGSMDVGLISILNGGSISNLVLTGKVEGEQYVGGFVGYMMSGKIENCTNAADISATRGYIGGICGTTSKGAVTGNGSINRCVNIGEIKNLPTRTGGYVGGIIGYTHASVTECSNLGDVISQNNGAGGICGMSYSSISKCYNMGNVSSPTNAGGICGIIRLAKPPVTTCFNGGKVTAKYASGIVGALWNTSSSCAINNSYNFGELAGSSENHFIVYNNFALPSDKISCSNVYYIDETKATSEYQGSTPLTEQELSGSVIDGFTKGSFRYPEITGVPYITKESIRFWNYDPAVFYTKSGDGIEFAWQNPSDDATGIELTITDKYDFSEIVSEKILGIDETSYFLPEYNNKSYYDVKLKILYKDNSTDYKNFEIYVDED